MASAALPPGSDPPRSGSRRKRSTLLGLIGGLGALFLALSPLLGSRLPAGGDAEPAFTELLEGGRFEKSATGWGAAGDGFRLAPAEGRAGSQALHCAATEPRRTTGAFRTLRLDRNRMMPLRVSGWSRAQEVDGAPGEDYSLHATVEYQDGTRLDGVSVAFDCGTHGWQRRELRLPAIKPIRTVVLHCLFRNHTGRVWFDDVSVEEPREPAGMTLLEGVPLPADPPRSRTVTPTRRVETRDGLQLEATDERVLSLSLDGRVSRPQGPSGFLVRDVRRNGAWQPIDAARLSELGLSFESRWQGARDHVSIEGRVRDLQGQDRAITLAFTVPVELKEGFWADDVRRTRPLAAPGEFVQAVPVPCGSTGTLSRYPLGAVFDGRTGLALAVDLADAPQFRIGYHASLRQLFVSVDVGLVSDGAARPGNAHFRFVLYRIDPRDGFRSALERLYTIFPSSFARRCLDAGAWLPFTPPERIPHWEDFGFAFHETTEDTPAPTAPGPQRFRYSEPLGFWLPLPPDLPRSSDELLARLRRGSLRSASLPLDVLERLAMKGPGGQPQFTFRREPWCDGVVFSINPNPRLPGSAAAPRGERTDGEFLDSLEGYAMADLDFDRDHLRHATVSPTFSIDTRVPVLFKAQSVREYTKAVAEELRRQGRFAFGNGTPHRFPFLVPDLDVLGTEVDWFPSGEFVPAPDADLAYRRAMSFQKPYCILLNTKPSNLTRDNLERYFQRCLFYGMFPGLFSHDAQNDSYWADADRIERDRPLFKKYVPLLRRTSAAGWQPVTGARCDNPAILVERFGPDAKGVLYLTLLNDSGAEQEGTVTIDRSPDRRTLPGAARELVTETAIPLQDRKMRISLPAGAARLIELRIPALR